MLDERIVLNGTVKGNNITCTKLHAGNWIKIIINKAIYIKYQACKKRDDELATEFAPLTDEYLEEDDNAKTEETNL